MAELPKNRFKEALRQGRQQIGFWCMLPDPYITEILCDAGFDWLLLDSEHSPTDLRVISSQIQAAKTGSASIVVRPPVNDKVIIKQYLDIGAQTLLLPMVQNADEARAAVSAMRYPPEGVRGVSGTSRATGFGRVKGYHKKAEQELCLLVQVETRAALDEIEAIAAVDGVDGIFIGPADLAASLGHLGNPFAPEVIEIIKDALARIQAAGKPAGILSFDEEHMHKFIALGTTFAAVGGDVNVLRDSAEKLAARFQSDS